MKVIVRRCHDDSLLPESNQQPSVYKTETLPIELSRQVLGKIRTLNPQIRSLILYPFELRAHQSHPMQEMEGSRFTEPVKQSYSTLCVQESYSTLCVEGFCSTLCVEETKERLGGETSHGHNLDGSTTSIV
jgi:hypothetical protein